MNKVAYGILAVIGAIVCVGLTAGYLVWGVICTVLHMIRCAIEGAIEQTKQCWIAARYRFTEPSFLMDYALDNLKPREFQEKLPPHSWEELN